MLFNGFMIFFNQGIGPKCMFVYIILWEVVYEKDFNAHDCCDGVVELFRR